MRSRALKCARRYVINHVCQALGPQSRKLSPSAVGCLVSDFLSFLCAFCSSVWARVFFLGHFTSFSQAATCPPLITPHVSADKRWRLTKHAGHMLAEITHAGLLSNISQGGRKGCMNHFDRARTERDIPLLSPHAHTLSEIYGTRL